MRHAELVHRNHARSIWRVGDRAVVRANVTGPIDLPHVRDALGVSRPAHYCGHVFVSGEIHAYKAIPAAYGTAIVWSDMHIHHGRTLMNLSMQAVPDTVMSAASGMMLSQLLAHPVLHGVDGRVISMHAYQESIVPGEFWHEIRFEHSLTGFPR